MASQLAAAQLFAMALVRLDIDLAGRSVRGCCPHENFQSGTAVVYLGHTFGAVCV